MFGLLFRQLPRSLFGGGDLLSHHFRYFPSGLAARLLDRRGNSPRNVLICLQPRLFDSRRNLSGGLLGSFPSGQGQLLSCLLPRLVARPLDGGRKPSGGLGSGLVGHRLCKDSRLPRRAGTLGWLRRGLLRRWLSRVLALSPLALEPVDRLSPELLLVRVHVAPDQPFAILGQRLHRLRLLSPPPCSHQRKAAKNSSLNETPVRRIT
jgi:hypothetical protein